MHDEDFRDADTGKWSIKTKSVYKGSLLFNLCCQYYIKINLAAELQIPTGILVTLISLLASGLPAIVRCQDDGWWRWSSLWHAPLAAAWGPHCHWSQRVLLLFVMDDEIWLPVPKAVINIFVFIFHIYLLKYLCIYICNIFMFNIKHTWPQSNNLRTSFSPWI